MEPYAKHAEGLLTMFRSVNHAWGPLIQHESDAMTHASPRVTLPCLHTQEHVKPQNEKPGLQHWVNKNTPQEGGRKKLRPLAGTVQELRPHGQDAATELGKKRVNGKSPQLQFLTPPLTMLFWVVPESTACGRSPGHHPQGKVIADLRFTHMKA